MRIRTCFRFWNRFSDAGRAETARERSLENARKLCVELFGQNRLQPHF